MKEITMPDRKLTDEQRAETERARLAITASLDRAQIDPDETRLDREQLKRARDAWQEKPGLVGNSLRRWILEGVSGTEQVAEAVATRGVREREEKRAARAAAQKGPRKTKAAGDTGGEQDSIPFAPEQAKKLKDPGYLVFYVDPDGPENVDAGDPGKKYVFLGSFPGQNRTVMAAAARAELRKQIGKAADRVEIVSVRPNGIRLTPALPAETAPTGDDGTAPAS